MSQEKESYAYFSSCETSSEDFSDASFESEGTQEQSEQAALGAGSKQFSDTALADSRIDQQTLGLAKKKPLVLIGLMGSGKTTVGRRLASVLKRTLLDCDRVIVERCGVPITTIFEVEGEEGFRKRESELLAELIRIDSSVLSTGGGVVLRSQNRQLLRQKGWVIFLRSTESELWRRLHRDRTRPLLQCADPRQKLQELLSAREPLYLETAHQIVESANQSVTALVSSIVAGLPAELREPSQAS